MNHCHCQSPPARNAVTLRGSALQSEASPNILSVVERRVALLLMDGYRERQIGEMLCMEPNEVAHHTQEIFRKVGVSDPLELILYAGENEL